LLKLHIKMFDFCRGNLCG